MDKKNILASSKELDVYVSLKDIINLHPYDAILKKVELCEPTGRNEHLAISFRLLEDKLFLEDEKKLIRKECNAVEIAEQLLKNVKNDDLNYLGTRFFQNIFKNFRIELIKYLFTEKGKIYEDLNLKGVGAVFSNNAFIDIFQEVEFIGNSMYVYDKFANLDIQKVEDVSVLFYTENFIIHLKDVNECETIKTIYDDGEAEEKYRFINGKIETLRHMTLRKEFENLLALKNDEDKFKEYAVSILSQNNESKRSKDFLDDLELF